MLNFEGRGVPVARVINDDEEKIIYLDKNFIIEREEKDPLVCKFCDKKYSQVGVANRHMLTCPNKDLFEFKQMVVDHIKNGMGESQLLNVISTGNNGREITFHDKDIDIWPLPRVDMRDYIYIAGPTGSGKSYLIARLLEGFRDVYPEHSQILFSRVNDDANFVDFIEGGQLMQIDIDDEELLDDPIDIKEELLKSVVIFDDIESMNPKLTKMLEGIREQIGLQGRDQSLSNNDIYCITSNHLLTDYKRTRSILNEATAMCCFPFSTSAHSLGRCLKLYFGLDRFQIEKIKKLPSRWVMVTRSWPQLVIYQKGIYIL